MIQSKSRANALSSSTIDTKGSPECFDDCDSEFESPSQRKSSKNRRICEEKKRWRRKKFNTAKWSTSENRLYANFLKANRSWFDRSIQQRRLVKIHVRMSQAVKTRSSNQCRSHHQKMMKAHRHVSQIIKYFEEPVAVQPLGGASTLYQYPNQNKRQLVSIYEESNNINEFRANREEEWSFEHIRKTIIWYDGFQFDYH